MIITCNDKKLRNNRTSVVQILWSVGLCIVQCWSVREEQIHSRSSTLGSCAFFEDKIVPWTWRTHQRRFFLFCGLSKEETRRPRGCLALPMTLARPQWGWHARDVNIRYILANCDKLILCLPLNNLFLNWTNKFRINRADPNIISLIGVSEEDAPRSTSTWLTDSSTGLTILWKSEIISPGAFLRG